MRCNLISNYHAPNALNLVVVQVIAASAGAVIKQALEDWYIREIIFFVSLFFSVEICESANEVIFNFLDFKLKIIKLNFSLKRMKMKMYSIFK